MRLIAVVLGLLAFASLTSGCDGTRSATREIDVGARFSPFEWLADPYAIARRPPGRAELASSRERESAGRFGNYDWNQFERVENGEAVLIDERGPGVVARLWFTFRQGSHDTAPGDFARLHVYVDGTEIAFTPNARGITLGELTSGTIAPFVRPWVAGRDTSTGAHQIYFPIAFAESIRISLDHVPERTTYYHVDWLRLPDDTPVESFDGSLDPADADALERATALWTAPTAEASTERTVELAPGAQASLEIDAPAVLREVGIEGDLEPIEASLAIDDASVVDGPALRWLAAPAPALPFASGLIARSPQGASMRYPAPVERRAVLTVHNTSASSRSLRLVMRFDRDAPAGLGRLAIQCVRTTAPATDVNVSLFAVDGMRGHYAGQSLVMRSNEWGWSMLEGDHEIAVDGEFRILGTGTEDYFGGAFYYLQGPYALPWIGAPGFDNHGSEHLRGSRHDVAQYRHHVLDAVAFDDRFEFVLESGAPRTDYEGCAYWYRDP